jgi:hypothetical protein
MLRNEIPLSSVRGPFTSTAALARDPPITFGEVVEPTPAAPILCTIVCRRKQLVLYSDCGKYSVYTKCKRRCIAYV